MDQPDTDFSPMLDMMSWRHIGEDVLLKAANGTELFLTRQVINRIHAECNRPPAILTAEQLQERREEDDELHK